MNTWIPVPESSDFPIENLPFGVVRPRAGGASRVATRVGDFVVDLAAANLAPELTSQATLNALMASGRGSEVRERIQELLTGRERVDLLLPIEEVEVLLPVAIGDFVDFYSSLQHATNLGHILRPEGEPLPPNWRHLPVAYHGRAGTITVSGTTVHRPRGLVPDAAGVPRLTPTAALDFELEVGFLVGGRPTTAISPDDAADHVFGAVLCNDWSARDIQSFEYQPLGPNLAKSFATTISPWVVTLDALRPYLVTPPEQAPEPDPYLRATNPWAVDLHLEVDLNGSTITATNFAVMYWTFAQQLAHITVNGATVRPGDLFASGTVSGPDPGEWGSLIEITRRGACPLRLPDGTERAFLADGDTVTLRGWCGDGSAARPRIGFGDARGTVVGTSEEA